MLFSRRRFLEKSTLAAAGLALPLVADRRPASAARSAVAGTFQPTFDSLAQYQTPDWFRDAKFGIWAHWGPQCQPGMGDWYARSMYIQGHKDYAYQCANYGHPSKAGFKEVIHSWKAERWDPEHLIGLYKAAGAKYFMCLGNHHDNFDNFDSKYQSWNSVAVGPKKDLVGGWEKAARAAGLHFAISFHASHAWSWYERSQDADKKGPLAGIPYDGKITAGDGKGLWWEGMDPHELYAQNHAPGKAIYPVWNWDVAKGSTVPDKAYCEKFYNRVMDAVDKYRPDQIYFDDSILPLYPVSDVGLRIAADYFNRSLQWNGGKLGAVLNGKDLDEMQRRCMVWDIERGASDRIEPLPWQTDTCIGNWHYQLDLFTRHAYKKPGAVALTLVDIVSKNGNLMLNIPLPGHGEPDADELAFLTDFTRWMNVCGDAIFGTRPWRVYGEGPHAPAASTAPLQRFNEKQKKVYTAQDFRFMQKNGILFAFAMAWPTDGMLTITSLGTASPTGTGKVARVELLGAPGSLKFTQDAGGLTMSLPPEKPCEYAYALKISGSGLTAAA